MHHKSAVVQDRLVIKWLLVWFPAALVQSIVQDNHVVCEMCVYLNFTGRFFYSVFYPVQLSVGDISASGVTRTPSICVDEESVHFNLVSQPTTETNNEPCSCHMKPSLRHFWLYNTHKYVCELHINTDQQKQCREQICVLHCPS